MIRLFIISVQDINNIIDRTSHNSGTGTSIGLDVGKSLLKIQIRSIKRSASALVIEAVITTLQNLSFIRQRLLIFTSITKSILSFSPIVTLCFL